MKYAVAKCAAKELEAVALEEARETTSTTTTTTPAPHVPEVFPPRPPSIQNAIPIAVQPLEGDKAILAEISIKENSFRPAFDTEKLQQAILSYRPVSPPNQNYVQKNSIVFKMNKDANFFHSIGSRNFPSSSK